MAKPYILGLTGSMGTGKSTVANFFRAEGIPVWDADEVVHKYYEAGGQGAVRIAKLRPEAVKDGTVDREALRAWTVEDPDALRRIEALIHPLVNRSRFDFLDDAEKQGHKIVILDIPLLYETRAEKLADAVLVVTAPAEVQRQRVMARKGMTKEAYETMLSKQVPDEEKRARADYVIESVDLEVTRRAVQHLAKLMRQRVSRA